jgi:hypothetical protein
MSSKEQIQKLEQFIERLESEDFEGVLNRKMGFNGEKIEKRQLINFNYETILKNVESLLRKVEMEYKINSKIVLMYLSSEFMITTEEVMFFMGLVSDLTPEDIFISIKEIKDRDRNPNSRFIWDLSKATILDKDGNIKYDPKNWVKFGKKWYKKRELVTNPDYRGELYD